MFAHLPNSVILQIDLTQCAPKRCACGAFKILQWFPHSVADTALLYVTTYTCDYASIPMQGTLKTTMDANLMHPPPPGPPFFLPPATQVSPLLESPPC